jgi:hypothetical protein
VKIFLNSKQSQALSYIWVQKLFQRLIWLNYQNCKKKLIYLRHKKRRTIAKSPLFLHIFVHSVSASVFGQMFFRPDIRFRPKVKNTPSVIHWLYYIRFSWNCERSGDGQHLIKSDEEKCSRPKLKFCNFPPFFGDARVWTCKDQCVLEIVEARRQTYLTFKIRGCQYLNVTLF